MIKFYSDQTNSFKEFFNTDNGYYVRTGILENGKDTGIDPFMRDFPSLLDIGIMGHCIHSKTGMCNQAGVQCYQGGDTINKPNMTFENYKSIVDQVEDKVFQIALGGRGDPNKHEDFENILRYTRDYEIVPNYTTSGFGLTDKEVKLTRQHCGAVAVSMYFNQYTYDAINKFVDAGCTTNIHFVLSNSSIGTAINMLENDKFPKGINAVIFLLHKPVGLGTTSNCLNVADERLIRFFNLVDNWNGNFSIGFDSCTIPGILNFTKNISRESIDTCEGGRFSAYISSDMIMVPCSFDQFHRWGVNLQYNTIYEAWHSVEFDDFRDRMDMACPKCNDRNDCFGGCPIVNITLCNRKERYEN